MVDLKTETFVGLPYESSEVAAIQRWISDQDFELNSINLRTHLWENEPAVYAHIHENDALTDGYSNEEGHSNLQSTAYGQVRSDSTDWSGRSVPEQTDLWLGMYLMPLAPEVQSYVNQFELTDVLRSAVPMLSQYFPACTVKLRLEIHPEDAWRHLFASILTNNCLDEAMERLDSFNDDWFLDLELAVRERMTFDVWHFGV